MGRSQQNSFEAAPFGSRTSHRHLSVDDRVLADATLSLSFIFFFFQSCSGRNGEVNLVLKYGYRWHSQHQLVTHYTPNKYLCAAAAAVGTRLLSLPRIGTKEFW